MEIVGYPGMPKLITGDLKREREDIGWVREIGVKKHGDWVPMGMSAQECGWLLKSAELRKQNFAQECTEETPSSGLLCRPLGP